MAASDGGHIWPPRSSDLRIQELTGAGPEGSTPDHVFAVLRGEGYLGNLDEMWKQHLAVKGITDTSEPFTDSIATTPPLSVGADIQDFASAPVGDDIILDISPSWGPLGFHVDSTDTYAVYGENNGDYIILGTMSTPDDISTLTQTNLSSDLGPPPEGVGISDAGDRIFYTDTNYIRSRALTSAWDVSTIQAVSASVQFTGLANPIRDMAIDHNGTYLIACDQTGKVEGCILGTPWDLSSAGSLTSTTIMNAKIGGGEAKAIAIDESGTRFYITNAVGTAVVHMGSMSTAGDLSTATVGISDKLTLTGTASNNPIGMSMAKDGQTLYVYGDVQNRVAVIRYSP